ncbi:hypothetical protein I8752_29245 [Nostocaceae cyanobacterium CENA369]|uniref:Uncharacterized protein n=1 Tax=Dendronalium phyllosphericum CENA369 TaxID=1725256 RepID=A0A8J7IEA0_9NOST|nr:hypothetical protein [Dendronalium phyllosphericum]MBH8576996.1 hypothetical protein [Dendronalium phyllosphericum CENA369]
MTKQKIQDPLFQLCKPSLLDLTALLAKSLKHHEEPMHELVGPETKIPVEVLDKMNELTESEKSAVLVEIANWIDSASRPAK